MVVDMFPTPSRSNSLHVDERKRSRGRPLNLKIQLPGKEISRSFPGPQHQSKPNQYVGLATEVIPHVFVGDQTVALNHTLLKDLNVTHIVNCVAHTVPNQFPNDFNYMSIEMRDNPSEDIFCLFYDTIDFIENAVHNGNVLIHCKCGISRSTTICIAYIMFANQCSYQKAFEVLHRTRSTCSPNAGFIISLQCWQYHLSGNPLEQPRLYKIESQQRSMQVVEFQRKSTNCFVLHTNKALYLWRGSDTQEENVKSALHFISQLQKYEKATHNLIFEMGGEESTLFLNSLEELNYRT